MAAIRLHGTGSSEPAAHRDRDRRVAAVNVLTELTVVAASADILALLFLFISITRVATDEGSITWTTATPLEAEVAAEYSDETADEKE